ncbi:MAG: GntR family transcriptional regulator [Ruminococcus flavefaciens]|nr:GntR family transcriptional regulator [Ruminococcus flavefaciens]
MAKESNIPLYRQIKNDIIHQIESSVFYPGDKLPTEQELSNHYYVSRITISKALSELKEEGILVSRPGKGTFVQAANAKKPTDAGPLSDGTPDSEAPPPISPGLTEIACIFPNITDMFALSLCNGIQSAFPADRYLCHTFQSRDFAGMNQLLHYCLTGNISGIALFPHDVDLISAELLALRQKNYPLVVVDHPVTRFPCSYVASGHEAGGTLCVNHLYELGHNRIAFLTTSSRDVVAVGLRIAGARKRVEQLNMARPGLHVIERFDIHRRPTSYAEYFRKLIFQHKVTAFIAADTGVCRYLYSVFDTMGLSIPNDVSLISFDNPQISINGMNYFTYIKQSEFLVGKEAGTILRRKIEHADSADYEKTIPPQLIINHSTGPIL